ncbi:hypothetical protein [Desertivirga brevis]|uniref:hypothetical protein n=1 Tax=Desertivirga brevis TaxID=2810310 RepID=UPI001A958151|nr:hypothetical protein [Pedobacter sp. SYSU D00873]
MILYSLIHVSPNGEQSTHNNFVTGLKDQIELYLSCAEQLGNSLRSAGIIYRIITNNKAFLLENKAGFPFEVIQLKFGEKVPSGLKFYSAHYKFEVIEYLSRSTEEYLGLIDPDIACISEIPYSLKQAIAKKVPLYYDITSQVTGGYGYEEIIRNKERLQTEGTLGLWAGGEFVCGSPDFFGRLYKEICTIKDNYFSSFHLFHHQGDEMLTSIALERLKKREPIFDAGNLKIIGRFWSVKPKHIQPPIEWYSSHFLLHLPSDKRFLINHPQLKGENFITFYKRYLIRKKIFRGIFSPIFPLMKLIVKKIGTFKLEGFFVKTPVAIRD